jgi:hypothetical protein
MDELIAFLRAVAEIDADDIHIDMNVHGINSRDGLDLLHRRDYSRRSCAAPTTAATRRPASRPARRT